MEINIDTFWVKKWRKLNKGHRWATISEVLSIFPKRKRGFIQSLNSVLQKNSIKSERKMLRD